LIVAFNLTDNAIAAGSVYPGYGHGALAVAINRR